MTATKVNLAEQASGLLPVANGGSGVGTLTGLVVGNGTSAFTTVTAPAGTIVGTTDTQTETNKTLSDTYLGTVFDDQTVSRATTLLANNRFVCLGTLEIASTGSVEIPSTSSLEVIRYVAPTSTDTMTNKRVVPRSLTSNAPGAIPTIDISRYDLINFTGLAAAITGFLVIGGTATLGQRLMLGFKDNGTARAITWPSGFVSSGAATLLATTVINKQHWVGLMYDGTNFACLAVDATGY